MENLSTDEIAKLIQSGTELPLATKNYPSRGQTAVQKLYETKKGKLFLKRASEQNHIDCQVDPKTGTLAEREFWAFCLAKKLHLRVPPLWLMDSYTTVQMWLDIPDAHIYKMTRGRMDFEGENVLDCALFDWLTGQIDRHDANYLYDYIQRQIVLVDSAHCFLKYEGSLPDYLHLFEIGSTANLMTTYKTRMKSILDALSVEDMQKLVPLKSEAEESALRARLEDVRTVTTIRDIIELYRGSRI